MKTHTMTFVYTVTMQGNTEEGIQKILRSRARRALDVFWNTDVTGSFISSVDMKENTELKFPVDYLNLAPTLSCICMFREQRSDAPHEPWCPQAQSKWCHYCKIDTHNDAECYATRPKDWKPEPTMVFSLDGSAAEMQPHYDFSKGERGKYYVRRISPDEARDVAGLPPRTVADNNGCTCTERCATRCKGHCGCVKCTEAWAGCYVPARPS